MGSLILFVLGVAAPLTAALAVLWIDERRRAYIKLRFDRLTQDNRGLKLALGSRPSAEPIPALTETDRREVNTLIGQLAQNGVLLEWLRLGTKPPAEAGAQLLGATPQSAALLQQAMADWGAPGIAAALDSLKERLASIAEMEMIWADPHANVEHDPSVMLGRAMWTFEPEFVVDESRYAVDPRFGAVAKSISGTGLFQSQQGREGEPTLVVELKSARVTVGADQQLQAWNNVRELIRGGTIRERDPVDVYVVGGAVDELDGNPRVEGRYRNVRITSYDYGHLVARAKRLTFGLYDHLKDTAPFLRQHREEIASAQRAAADQAASEASNPLTRPAEEAGPLRHEEYSDEPRRGEYVEDEPVSSEPAPVTVAPPAPVPTQVQPVRSRSKFLAR
ncbi:MAG: hypothetical protein K8S25_03375 [Alphaproteobacteria bacterium]|nr:hypothetical protein [Alphaproteobacteria bacterium]